MSKIVEQINYVGYLTISALKTIYELYRMAIRLVLSSIKHLFSFFSFNKSVNRSIYTQTIYQILFTGVEALPLVAITAITTGVIFFIQSINQMPQIGASEYFGNLTIILIRDIGPIIVTLIVVARSGSALSVYISNMKVNKEIAALESLGIDPENYLILPSFIGLIVSILILSFYFGLIASIGGLLVASIILKIPFIIFTIKIFNSAHAFDVLQIVIKSIINGTIISIVSGYYALNVNNIREVSMAVIKSVVTIILILIVLNILLFGGLYRIFL